jgi:predicted adenine nucleotide alpha hydrolase (AANH) superfamily ATPase
MYATRTPNGLTITKEMVLNSLETFKDKPIVLNNGQDLNDYTDDEIVTKFKKEHEIGIIHSAEIDGFKVIGDVTFFKEEYKKDKFDNWQIELSEDKQSFNYCSCEIFN